MTPRARTPLRTATLQFRVTPAVKHASQEILHRIGLTMTEAIELFLRRLTADQRIPFEIAALNDADIARFTNDRKDGEGRRRTRSKAG
jgi:addiction module RelB/DinJ family antitoxin